MLQAPGLDAAYHLLTVEVFVSRNFDDAKADQFVNLTAFKPRSLAKFQHG